MTPRFYAFWAINAALDQRRLRRRGVACALLSERATVSGRTLPRGIVGRDSPRAIARPRVLALRRRRLAERNGGRAASEEISCRRPALGGTRRRKTGTLPG